MKKFLLLLFLIPFNLAVSQVYTISGHIESVPSMTNAYSGITFKEINTNTIDTTETNPTTGNFTKNIPNGTYEITIKTKNHFRYVDTLNVNDNQTLDLQMVENLPMFTTYYNNIMEIINTLQFSRPTRKGKTMRIRDQDQPIRVFHDNLPSQEFLDKYLVAKNDLFTKTHGTIGLREANTDSASGIKIHYVPYDSIGGAGYTYVDASYTDGTPKHITMLIANDRGAFAKVFKREFARAIQTLNTIDDPNFIQAKESDAMEYHVNEGDAFEIIYKLKTFTPTWKYKDTTDTTITGVREIKNKQPEGFKLE